MSKRNMIFKKNVVAHALVLAFGSGVLAVGVTPVVMAQSNATGNVFGNVASPAGSSILLQNLDNGFKRTSTVDASGRFNVTGLPIGRYKVDLIRDGKVASSTNLEVNAGQGSNADFAAVTQSVEIVARRSRIDISNTNNGAIYTAKELARLPVAQNLSAVALLAPNTVASDPAFPGVSFGGGGASENAFYINGFPTTNPLTQVGTSQLPFGAIAQTSVLTGGYGAEYGRSIGGVLAVTTKSGTNRWEAGFTASTMPNGMRAPSKNIIWPNNGFAATDGKIRLNRELNTTTENQVGVYVGGPIIQDKLMMFVAVDQTNTNSGFAADQTSTTLARDGWTATSSQARKYLAKFDWNISDDHRLEWTSIGDETNLKTTRYGFDARTGKVIPTKWSESYDLNPGSRGNEINFLRYAGQFNDLSVSTLYGENHAKRGTTYEGYDINGILRSQVANPENRVPALEAQGLYKNYQKFPGNISKPGEDIVKSFRLDLEYKLGDHTIRGGIDDVKVDSKNAGVFRSGGGTWTFNKLPAGQQFVERLFSGGRKAILANYGGYGVDGYSAQLFEFSSLTTSGTHQNAFYLEDRYQVTKNLFVTGGVRLENYENSSGDNKLVFISVKNQIAPRLAAAWDVNGDSTFKVFGSAGRYHLPLPSSVAARAAGVSLFSQQDFTYTGIDALGQPTGLKPINTPVSVNNELNQIKDPRAVATKNLKPNYQDEITLGFEKAYNANWNYGVKGTMRQLGDGIDDNCDFRPIDAAAAKGNYVADPMQELCYIWNPGKSAEVYSIDTTGKGRYVTYSKEELGYPTAKREYKALDFFVEHAFRNGWYGKLTYTLSRSSGNMEGQTRSDTGQQDIGISANWDVPELMTYASGVLPNDRTHVLKANGYYELNSEWAVGASFLASSGRPKACLGTDTVASANVGYGGNYFFCEGRGVQRGSIGRMPYQTKLDVNVTYTPGWMKDLSFKLDIFNLTNNQVALTRSDTRENGAGNLVSSYGLVTSLEPAMRARLGVVYNKKF
nr:TonB-dependent receptor [uncultured Undibacterium sp.]